MLFFFCFRGKETYGRVFHSEFSGKRVKVFFVTTFLVSICVYALFAFSPRQHQTFK